MKKGAIFGKKQLVMAVLVLALGIAVYMNFVLVPPNTPQADTGEKNLGDTIYVNGSVSGSAASKAEGTQSGPQSGTPAAAVSKPASGNTASDNTDYFAKARTDRQKSHNDALNTLKEITNNVKADASTKEKVAATASLLAKNIEKENAIETLIKGKGYADAVAIISDDNVTVIVKTANLLDSQTLQIQDIVVTQTKLSLDKITIVPKK